MESSAIMESLLAYLAASDHVVTVVLLVERDRQQLSIYYVNHVLAGAEQRYPFIEKFAYTLLIASQKLHPYFESHHIIVLIGQPL